MRVSLHKGGFICGLVLLLLLNSTISSSALHLLETGMEAPDFKLSDFGNSTRSFSSLKGEKLTLVLFWATWGENSEKALKMAEIWSQRYRKQGLAVVGVNIDRQEMSDDTIARIQATVQRQHLTFPVLLDRGLVTFERYGVIAAPTLLVLDSQRIVRFELTGFPLMGVEALQTYLAWSLDGKKPASEQVESGYRPDKKAVRFWHMGKRVSQSGRGVEHAKGWFEKAVQADPSFVLPYISLGELAYRHHDLVEAQKRFEQALSKAPENPIALTMLGQTLMEMGNTAAAEQHLAKAAKADTAYLPSVYLLGYLKGKQGDMQQALVYFAKGEQMNPNDYRLFMYKGMLLEQCDDKKAATAAYKRALQLLVGLP